MDKIEYRTKRIVFTNSHILYINDNNDDNDDNINNGKSYC